MHQFLGPSRSDELIRRVGRPFCRFLTPLMGRAQLLHRRHRCSSTPPSISRFPANRSKLSGSRLSSGCPTLSSQPALLPVVDSVSAFPSSVFRHSSWNKILCHRPALSRRGKGYGNQGISGWCCFAPSTCRHRRQWRDSTTVAHRPARTVQRWRSG